MSTAFICQCKISCKTRRCACLKSGSACGVGCLCKSCNNPLNNLEGIEDLTACVLQHIARYQALSEKEKSTKHDLPCGCHKVRLKDLFHDYECPTCEETYFYSFCFKEVVQTDDIWHCRACGTCKESSEWHCKRCDECTYGLSLPCDGCGKKSPYMT